MQLNSLLRQMSQAVRDDKQGDLRLGWRLRLWSAMQEEFGKEANIRRNMLAFLVAQDAYARWRQGELISAIPPDDIDVYKALPGRAMDEYAKYLQGKSSRKKVHGVWVELVDNLDYWTGKPHVEMQTAQIVIQKVADRILGLDDETYNEQGWYAAVWQGSQHRKITDASLGETLECDGHYFAAFAAAERSKNQTRGRREFWQRWLSELVPSVLAPIADVKALTRIWKPQGSATLPEASQGVAKSEAQAALREHLQALALTAGQQRNLYTEIACQICGLTTTVGSWTSDPILAALIARQNAKRRKSLSRIQQLIASVAQDGDVPCFGYDFTRNDARWKESRSIARELLDDYGWPRNERIKTYRFLAGLPAR